VPNILLYKKLGTVKKDVKVDFSVIESRCTRLMKCLCRVAPGA
jgi:hypothetical protein